MITKEALIKLINGLEDPELAKETNEVEFNNEIDLPEDMVPKQLEEEKTEEAEIEAPPVDEDITILTSNDAIVESLDLRLSSFWKKQEELEAAVKILTSEVKALQSHFSEIETSIDAVSNVNPTGEKLADLINMI